MTIRASIGGLRNDLEALLEGEATAPQLKRIVRLCHAIAEGALARRGHLGHLIQLHGLNLTDLAFDCISDLFARSDDGRYRALESYFSAYDLAGFSDEETFFHLQRLSFTKVRNGLFRLYSEMDPQLARILHNVKIAVRTLGLFTEVDRLGESCLVPSLSDTCEHLPSADVTDLTIWLGAEASGNEFIPELLGKLSKSLSSQHNFSRVVPLVTIGLAIRAFYREKELPRLVEPVTIIDDAVIDAADVIARACDNVKNKMYAKYVERGKVSPEVFIAYFRIITEMLELRFVMGDSVDYRLSENFLKLMSGISPEEYRKKHRNRLEYLARMVRKKVARTLQEG
jgi:hypothetical protein